MNAPGFSIPCNPPLLPVNIDLLPNGIKLTQGVSLIVLDATGLEGLLQVAGLIALLRLSAQHADAMTAVPIKGMQ